MKLLNHINQQSTQFVDMLRKQIGWWYPSGQTLQAAEDRRLAQLNEDLGIRQFRVALTLLLFGFFCLISLESPDALLLSDDPVLNLPFVGSQVSFTGFIVAGPLILLSIWIYLHTLTEYRRRIHLVLTAQKSEFPPSIFDLKHPFIRFFFIGSYVFLLPVVMIRFIVKSSAIPGFGLVLFWLALLMLSVQIVAFSNRLARQKLRWIIYSVVILSVIVLGILGRSQWDEVWTRPYNLYRADLSDSFLPKKNLRYADFTRANLSGAILISADLTGATFSNTNLQDANLHNAVLKGAVFRFSNLREGNFSGADFHNTYFVMADAREANFNRANLTGALLNSSDFSGASMQLARLDSSSIIGSVFTETDLRNASLDQLKFDFRLNETAPFQGSRGLSSAQLKHLKNSINNQSRPIYDASGNIIGFDQSGPVSVNDSLQLPAGQDYWESAPESTEDPVSSESVPGSWNLKYDSLEEGQSPDYGQ